ncbi:MAG: glycosyltransferase family 2 protein [Gemmatimonadota bacterium]|nr:glycosyltransferase family 2 protein [Gemmatimonadota bacterium]
MLTLSIVIPCYNEARRIDHTLDAVEALRHPLSVSGVRIEVIAVDDGSTDDTYQRLAERASSSPMPLVALRHERNRGKGAAIRTAREHVHGDLVIFQDADMELDPSEIPRVIAPLVAGRADASLGSRFMHRHLIGRSASWHEFGNSALTWLSNAFSGLRITDMESGYKAFSAPVFHSLHLTSDRFGMEPEIVARLAQMRARIIEVPVTYAGRSYAEGKKITWRDGFAAIGHIMRASLTGASQPVLPSAARLRATGHATPYRILMPRSLSRTRTVSAPGAHTAPSKKRAI